MGNVFEDYKSEEEPGDAAPILTLDMILMDSCPDTVVDDTNLEIHTISVHCVEYVVVAKPLGGGRYDVKSFTKKAA